MAKKVKLLDYFKFFMLSVFVAFVLTMLIGLLFGYKYILVNGSSSAQQIPFQSFILTYKCSKDNLRVNDFATTQLGKSSYLTHQVIGIKYEGYFEVGDCYSWEMNGNTFHAYYGYQVGSDQKNITAKPGPAPDDEETQRQEKLQMTLSNELKTNCNLITMANSLDGNTTKEYRNFEEDFEGKVIWYNYTLGKTMFVLRDSSWKNRILLIGLIYSVAVVFIMSNQSKLSVEFYN